MNALPALDLKIKVDEVPSGPRTKKSARARKVIKLPLPKKAKKTRGLSDAKRAEMVVEFRMKARKLARSILRRWHARLDLDEVDSVVDLSLCEAVKRFNPNKGASFMTFLYYHLRGNLIRTVSSAASANSVPLPEGEALDGLLNGGGISRQAYRGINAAEVAEALCSNDTPLPDEMLYKKELVELSQEACNSLDTLEREVIFRIYMEEQQLMDIARSLGYSRCHISRVKKKALDTLYQEMRASAGNEANLPSVRPNADEDERQLRTIGRRQVQRRRPRSKSHKLARREKLTLVRAVG